MINIKKKLIEHLILRTNLRPCSCVYKFFSGCYDYIYIYKVKIKNKIEKNQTKITVSM